MWHEHSRNDQPRGAEWTQMTGYIRNRRSRCSTCIHVDIGKKHDISYNVVGERLIIAVLTSRTSATRLEIANIYLPPQGSAFGPPLLAEELLGKAAQNNMCADLNWRPTTAGAAELWSSDDQLPKLP